MAAILIIGEDPDLIDFDAPGAPPEMSAAKVHDGLNGSRDRLIDEGHAASILLTGDDRPIEDQLAEAVAQRHYDVIVIGAGLRTLPAMIERFERLMNAIRRRAPAARLAFNSNPADSDVAARRWIGRR